VTAGAAALALGGKILGATRSCAGGGLRRARARGNDHIHGFTKVPGTELAAVCDVDESVSSKAIGEIEKLGLPKAEIVRGCSELLKIKISMHLDCHAESLAFADGYLGMQAGKDVYVEKPAHTIRLKDGTGARGKKYNRICQHGSQSRSNPGMQEAD